MMTGLDQLIEALVDKAQPLPVSRLAELSDLEPPQIDQFREAWAQIPVARRKSLLVELGQLADLHFEYSFESINRLALDDEDPDARRIAIENLWECEDTSLAQKLLNLLREDNDHSVRSASANALAPFVYLCEVSDPDSEVMSQIEEALLQAFQADPDVNVRLRSLEALGHSSRAEIPSLIQQAYDIGDDDHKHAALLAMGRSASIDWSDIILAEFLNPSPDLRARAATAAGQIELRNSIPELIDLLEDVNAEVRLAAIWSLGQLGGSNATDALSTFLEISDDPDEVDLITEAIDHAIFIDSTRNLVNDDEDQDEGIVI